MPPRTQPTSNAPLTVSQMAERMALSRRRFYELVEAGKLPPPVYRLDSRRPYYPSELQEECLRVRATGEALDGTLILFNRPRQRVAQAAPRRSTGGAAAAPAPAQRPTPHADLIGYLGEHGVTVTAAQVEEALRLRFPDGTESVDQGRVWREVFRHLRGVNRT